MKWTQIKLGDAATFVNGYAFKPEDWSDTGCEIIRIQNLTGSSKEVNYYSGQLNDKYKVRKGDLLISWSATLGIYEWNSLDGWLNQHIFKVVFNKHEFDKIFFKYLISKSLKSIENEVHGSTMKHITKKRFDEIQIPLPPLSIQQKIAAILDAADAYRQKTRALIEKYDLLAQSLFLEMFGDPVRNEMGWEKKTIGESCYFIKDGPHVSPKYVENGIPFISVNNIIKGYWDLDNVRQISVEDHQIFRKRCNPEKGDILYTKGGTTGFAKLIDIDLEFSNWVHLAVLKFDKSKLNGKFFESMLNSKYCYNQSQIATRGIANRDLVLGQMKTITHLIPPIELQTLFADRIALIDQQKQQAQQSLEKAEALFNSLLQRAFKGELVRE